MTDEEVSKLAAEVIRQQNEKAAVDAEVARVNAETAAKAAAEKDEAERPAREAAAREAAGREAAINAVLSAPWNAQFVDGDGTVHRKAAPAAGHTFETAGRTKEGQTVIGRWGRDRDNSPLAGWKAV